MGGKHEHSHEEEPRSLVVPDLDDVPEDDEEPLDAGVEHLATPEEVERHGG
jgi:hypothetical protein